MPASSRSFLVSSSVRATAFVLAALASACTFDGTAPGRPAGYDGTGPAEGETGEDGAGPDGQGGGSDGDVDVLGCPGRATLIPLCNYVTTAEANIAAGFTPIEQNEDFAKTGRKIFDLYQPTDECKEALATWMAFDESWNGDEPSKKKARDAALTGLHTLFFHPIMVPEDGSFIWNNSPIKMETGFWKSLGAMPIPETHDYVLQRSYVNEKLMSRFRNLVSKIIYKDNIVDGNAEIHMQTWGGHVDVNAFWLTHPEGYDKNDPKALAKWKYVIAASFFHEMQHADGLFQHDGCSSENYGFESACDTTLANSSYGRQMQIGQAFFYGLAFSRRANDYGLFLAETPMRINYSDNCEKATEKVNDVAKWVRINDTAREMCKTGAPVDSVLSLRKKPPTSPAGGPAPEPTNETSGADWQCI